MLKFNLSIHIFSTPISHHASFLPYTLIAAKLTVLSTQTTAAIYGPKGSSPAEARSVSRIRTSRVHYMEYPDTVIQLPHFVFF